MAFELRLSGLRATPAKVFRVFFGMVAGAALLATPGSSSPAVVPGAEQRLEISSYLRPEVRLRKLHLVRPDLIQYPLVYDIVC